MEHLGGKPYSNGIRYLTCEALCSKQNQITCTRPKIYSKLRKRKPNFLNIASVESNPTNTKAHLPKQQSKSASRLSPLSPLCYPSREHLTSSLSVKFDHRLSLLSHSFEWLRSLSKAFLRYLLPVQPYPHT